MRTESIRKTNLSKKQAVITAVVIAIVAVSLTISVSVIPLTEKQVIVQPARPSPPPFPMEMWGQEIPIDDARKQLGFDKITMPLNIPDGLALQSTRVIVSEDGTYRQLTQFYGKITADTSDKAIINDFLNNNSLMVIFIEDDMAKPFDWKINGPKIVSEAPTKRDMNKVNGLDTLIVKGQKTQEKSEVMFDIGKTRIDIVSKSFDVNQLIPIAQSIRG